MNDGGATMTSPQVNAAFPIVDTSFMKHSCPPCRVMSKVVVLLVIALVPLHQDFWLWNDRSLVFGLLPIGLAYHMGFSIAAAMAWLLVVRHAWPTRVEHWADQQGEKP